MIDCETLNFQVFGVANELSSERDWALKVLKERHDALTGFERLRVDRIISSELRELSEAAVVEGERIVTIGSA